MLKMSKVSAGTYLIAQDDRKLCLINQFLKGWYIEGGNLNGNAYATPTLAMNDIREKYGDSYTYEDLTTPTTLTDEQQIIITLNELKIVLKDPDSNHNQILAAVERMLNIVNDGHYGRWINQEIIFKPDNTNTG